MTVGKISTVFGVMCPGSVVDVAVGRHNRKRVTIDVGQGGTRGQAEPSDSRLTGMPFG
jgi:hypothetical protein